MKVKNLSELAEHLIELGNFLKSLPNKELPQADEAVHTLAKRKGSIKAKPSFLLDIGIEKIALELKGLGRDEAKQQLGDLSVTQLVKLADLLQIPIVKKTKKQNIVAKILWTVFDFEGGQRVLEEFHKKQALRPEQVSFEENLRYYRENLRTFIERYGGKYIAIVDNEVVDMDIDFSALAKRVYERFGYREVFMPKVEEPRPVNIPAPRLRQSV